MEGEYPCCSDGISVLYFTIQAALRAAATFALEYVAALSAQAVDFQSLL
jgi:hypothetical protein